MSASLFPDCRQNKLSMGLFPEFRPLNLAFHSAATNQTNSPSSSSDTLTLILVWQGLYPSTCCQIPLLSTPQPSSWAARSLHQRMTVCWQSHSDWQESTIECSPMWTVLLMNGFTTCAMLLLFLPPWGGCRLYSEFHKCVCIVYGISSFLPYSLKLLGGVHHGCSLQLNLQICFWPVRSTHFIMDLCLLFSAIIFPEMTFAS